MDGDKAFFKGGAISLQRRTKMIASYTDELGRKIDYLRSKTGKT